VGGLLEPRRFVGLPSHVIQGMDDQLPELFAQTAFIEDSTSDIQGVDDKFGDFISACLDHLDGETTQVPTLDGMTDAEIRKCRWWLESLIQWRNLGPEGLKLLEQYVSNRDGKSVSE